MGFLKMLAEPLGPVLPMGRGRYAPADALAPVRAGERALDGVYVRNAAGIVFGCPEGSPVIQIVRGLKEVFPVSCWRDSRGQTLYLGFVVDLHIERFGLPVGTAEQEAWARECLDAVGQYEAEAWKTRRSVDGAGPATPLRKPL